MRSLLIPNRPSNEFSISIHKREIRITYHQVKSTGKCSFFCSIFSRNPTEYRHLTHSRPIFQSKESQSINLLCKSIDWFLYYENIGFSCPKSAANLCVHSKYGKIKISVLVHFLSSKLNPFQANIHFLYPLEGIRKSQDFYIFRGYRKGKLSWNGFNIKFDCSNESYRRFYYQISYSNFNEIDVDFFNIKVLGKGGVIVQTGRNSTKSIFLLKSCLGLIYYKVGINTNEFIYKIYNDNSTNYL